VDWTSVPGADSYVLSQQRDDGVWKKIYEGPDTIVKRKSLPDGSYCYRVRALQAQTYGAWSVVQCTVAGQSAPETAYSMFLPLLSK